MQDSIWDGIKRDRGRWIGDQEVIDRVVGDVFGDGRLVRDELAQDVGTGPLDDHVNGLPGYSAWWVVAEAEYLRRWGDIAAVREQKTHLLEVLARMDAELDARGVYVAASGRKPFVDWSKRLQRGLAGGAQGDGLRVHSGVSQCSVAAAATWRFDGSRKAGCARGCDDGCCAEVSESRARRLAIAGRRMRLRYWLVLRRLRLSVRLRGRMCSRVR